MKTVELSAATRPLSEYVAELGGDFIILTSKNEPVAALVSLDYMEIESLSLSLNPQFAQILDEARAEFSAGKKLSLDEMKREMDVD